MATQPLTGLVFSLVGPGRVGESLARWAARRGGRLAAIATRRPAAARGLADELGAAVVTAEELSAVDQDLLLLAVPDPALEDVAARLSRRPQAAVALHTAGSRGAEAIAALRRAGCRVGSLHPLKAFPAVLPDPAAARGTFFAVDGDPAAACLAQRLARAWGGRSAEVAGPARLLYHLAATLAAGGTVTLLAACQEIAAGAGLPPAVMDGYFSLARGALAGAATLASPAFAVTGPVVRGEADLVRRQAAALRAAAPELVDLALVLARAALRQHARVAPLGPAAAALARRLATIDLNAERTASFIDPDGSGC